MKKLLAILSLVVFAPILYAQQNTLTQTTASAAQSDSSNVIQLTSHTNVTYGPSANQQTILYLDGEQENVLNITGNAITVSRGQAGTRAVAHTAGAVVLLGRPSWFYRFSPAGACVTANVFATPWVNVLTNTQWLCSSITLNWVPGFKNTTAQDSVTAAVTAATTTTLSGPLFHVTGATTITAFGIPVGAIGANFCIIPDGTPSITATNNIALASTAVANKTLCYTWDATNSKYTPSY